LINNRLHDYLSFSCPGKKRTKRIRHRGGADREAYRNSLSNPPFFPGFEPPSPVYPFRRLSELFLWSEQSKSNSSRINSTGQRIVQNNDSSRAFDGGRVGVWGRAAQSRDISVGLPSQKRKTLWPAHPPAAFFGSFLVRTQERNKQPRKRSFTFIIYVPRFLRNENICPLVL
jgi:hypothetical protein